MAQIGLRTGPNIRRKQAPLDLLIKIVHCSSRISIEHSLSQNYDLTESILMRTL
jgi:hypothetical protein